MDKNKMKRIWKTLLNVVMYIFLILCIFTVFITISARRATDGAAEFFGYQMRIVVSDSMAKCENTDVSNFDIKHIPVKSMVFVKTMPKDKDKYDDWYRNIEVGDVLTFRYVYTTQETITHRVISVTEKETGGFIIELKGDNTNSDDGALIQTIDTSVPNNMNYVIGKVTGKSYLIGLIISFITQPLGMVLVVMVPCFIIILLEVLKIIGMYNASKKERDDAAAAETERELAELKAKLAMLEAQQGTSDPETDVETAPVEDNVDTVNPTEEEV